MNNPLQAVARHPQWPHGGDVPDPELNELVREIIGRIAEKWTMLVIETLAEHGHLRFTQLMAKIGGLSQKKC